MRIWRGCWRPADQGVPGGQAGIRHTHQGGAVGAIALAIPLAWSLIEFALLAVTRSKAGRIAFGMVLLMSFYSIGENLEILAYLIWPGLLVMGIAARELQQVGQAQTQA